MLLIIADCGSFASASRFVRRSARDPLGVEMTSRGYARPHRSAFPGDPNPTSAAALRMRCQPRYEQLAPRFGFAYAPKLKEGSSFTVFANRHSDSRASVSLRGDSGRYCAPQLTAPVLGHHAYFEEVGGTLATHAARSVPELWTQVRQPTIPNPFLAEEQQVGVDSRPEDFGGDL